MCWEDEKASWKATANHFCIVPRKQRQLLHQIVKKLSIPFYWEGLIEKKSNTQTHTREHYIHKVYVNETYGKTNGIFFKNHLLKMKWNKTSKPMSS